MSDEILVMSSCTASKLPIPREESTAAEALYTGQQHLRLMRGVTTYRAAGAPAGDLCFRILSARHGLLSSTSAIKPYDQSFSGLPAPEIRSQAQKMQIPGAVEDALRRPFRLGLLLLADPYLRACDLSDATAIGGPLIAFCSPAAATRLPRLSGLRTVTLSNVEARRFSCGMIALKGELGRRILERLAHHPDQLDQLTRTGFDVLGWLDDDAGERQLEFAAA